MHCAFSPQIQDARETAMSIHRLIAAAILAVAATAAVADEFESAYDAGRYAEALALLEARGLEGDIESQGMAGMMHLLGSRLYGTEVPTDAERAARWLRTAALNSSVQAQYILAQLYEQGIGVPQDSARAAAWQALVAGQNLVFSIAQNAER